MKKIKGNEEEIFSKICPRCKRIGIGKYPAISRRDNKTEICSKCGEEEAMLDFLLSKNANSKKPVAREVRFLKKLLNEEK